MEKVNRKDALLEERTKIEETASHYKEALAENADHYRNIQLRELEVLARALAVYHSAPAFPEHAKLARLWTALAQTPQGATLNQNAASTANVLKEFANDRKLQKALTAFVTENGEKVQEVPQEAQPEAVVEEETVVVVIEEFKNEKGETETVEVIDRIHNGVEEITVVTFTEEPKPTVAVEEKVSEVQEPTPTPAPVVEEVKETVPAPAAPATETAPAGQRQDRPYKGKGPYKPREPREPREGERREGGERRGDGRRRYNEGEKRVYKPKYQERAEEKEEAGSSSSSSPETRNFRKEEIRQLEDEGFIVVGKPKPKAKDQQAVYDHQHGKKYHRPPQEKKV